MFGPIQVFQRRIDGSVDFFRSWAAYKNGFSVVGGEFWLGNDNIHSLTSGGVNVLRIDMEAWDGETAFAAYTNFSIDDESTNYTLRFANMTASSNAGKLNKTIQSFYFNFHICNTHIRECLKWKVEKDMTKDMYKTC